MSASQLLSATLEVAINRVLQTQPDAVRRLARHGGRRVRVQLSTPAWSGDLLIDTRGRIVVLEPAQQAADVSISGPLPGLIRLALRDGHGSWPSGVHVDGDVDLLDQLQRIAADLDLDVESLLERAVGGIAAARIGGGLRSLLGWGRQSLQVLGLDAAEYLREETRSLARRPDAEVFETELEQLRDAVARLDARLERMELRIRRSETGSLADAPVPRS